MSVTIAVDAMGGDFGPRVTVAASLRFLEETPDAAIILVGLEHEVRAALATARSTAKDRVKVHPATEVVEMHEPPADALRRKKDSSMRVAINLVKGGSAQACISAGNTGALMAISRFVLKTLPGIDRPAIAIAPAVRDQSQSRRADVDRRAGGQDAVLQHERLLERAVGRVATCVNEHAVASGHE